MIETKQLYIIQAELSDNTWANVRFCTDREQGLAYVESYRRGTNTQYRLTFQKHFIEVVT